MCKPHERKESADELGPALYLQSALEVDGGRPLAICLPPREDPQHLQRPHLASRQVLPCLVHSLSFLIRLGVVIWWSFQHRTQHRVGRGAEVVQKPLGSCPIRLRQLVDESISGVSCGHP